MFCAPDSRVPTENRSVRASLPGHPAQTHTHSHGSHLHCVDFPARGRRDYREETKRAQDSEKHLVVTDKALKIIF